VLSRKYSITWDKSPALFALVIFQIRSHTVAQVALECDSSTYSLLCIWDYRLEPSYPAYLLKWSLAFSGLTLNHDPLDLHLWIAGIIDVSHCAWLKF
jgi:hypothetical protein